MRQAIAILAIFTLLIPQRASAGPAVPVQITWEELAGVVVAQKIAVKIPDGAELQGLVLAVRPDSLVLDVTKTSQKKLHPKGQSVIARDGITEVWVLRERNALFRVIFALMGAGGGFLGTSAVAYVSSTAAAVLPCILVLIPLSAAAGYYAGKMADRTRSRIEIIP